MDFIFGHGDASDGYYIVTWSNPNNKFLSCMIFSTKQELDEFLEEDRHWGVHLQVYKGTKLKTKKSVKQRVEWDPIWVVEES